MDQNYIASNKSLKELCKKIRKGDVIALDTEFIRRTTYYPILSLIQVAHKKEIYLIDCLAKGIKISPILKIINSSKVKKILHSSSQDLEIFYRQSGCNPKNIEDTQVLANFAGFELNYSYARLINEFLGIEIDKKMQVSNWLRRPLSSKQLEYAKIDVIYLEEIYDILRSSVEKKNLLSNYQQDIKSLVRSLSSNNLDSLTKPFLKGRRKVFRQKKVPMTKVLDFVVWRDKMARQADVPRRHLVSDDNLQRLILGKDVKVNFTGKALKSLAKLLKKSNYALDLEVKSYNIEYDKDEFSLIRKELADIAKRRDIDERFIISSSDLQSIFYQGKKTDNLTGWRIQIIDELKNIFGYEK